MADLKVSVLMSLVDQFTGPLARITGSLTALKRQEEGVSNLRNMSMPFLVGGAAVVGALGLATKSAADFQEGMVGVQKTTGFTDGEIGKLSDQFLDLSTRIPQSANELAKIGEIGGQLGITGVENVAAFTETVAKLSSVTDLTAETGGEAIATLANQFKLPISQASNMASVINELSNVSNATAGDIADMSSRMAGAGKTIGLTMPQVAGLSAALKDLVVSNEVGGTAMSDMFLEMLKRTDQFGKVAGVSGAQFKQAMEKDAMGALTQVLTGLQRFDKFQIAEMLGDMGLAGSRSADVLLKLADATKSVNGEASLLSRHIGAATTAFAENTSLDKEFNTGLRAINAQASILKNTLMALAIEGGEGLLPILTPLIKRISEFTRGILAFAKANPQAMQNIMKMIAVLGGLSLVIGGALAVASAIGAIGIAMAGLPAAGAALGAIGGLIGSSLLPVIAIVAAVVGGFLLLKKAWDENLGGIQTKVQGFVQSIEEGFWAVSSVVKGALAIFRGEEMSMDLEMGLSVAGLMDEAEGVANILKFLKGLWDGFSEGASPVIGEIISGLLDSFKELGAVVGPILSELFGAFGGEGQDVASTAQIIGQAIASFVVIPFQIAAAMVRAFATRVMIVITVFKTISQVLATVASYIVSFVQQGIQRFQAFLAFIQNLWTQIKSVFSNGLAALRALVSNFDLASSFRSLFQRVIAFLGSINLAAAGAKIIQSLVTGIQSGVGKAVGAIKGVVQRIRNHLPFSPAKEGPLRDIMKIRIVEPIAQAITPAPVLARLRRVVSVIPEELSKVSSPGFTPLAAASLAAAISIPSPAISALPSPDLIPSAVTIPQAIPRLLPQIPLPRPAPTFQAPPAPGGKTGGGSVIHLNYSPQITINDKQGSSLDLRAELEKHSRDLERMLRDLAQREGRLTF